MTAAGGKLAGYAGIVKEKNMKNSKEHLEYMRLAAEVKDKIPKDEWKEVMSQDFCEYEFYEDDANLGFLSTYETAKKHIPKGVTTVIDFGCYLAAQSYMFTDYDKYIGIDVGVGSGEKRFTPPNSVHEISTIQDYININTFNQKEIFAICSYVPDDEAKDLVEQFDSCYIYYPGDREVLKVNGNYLINERKTKRVKEEMMHDKTEMYVKICERAESLGYNGERISLMMDIESADKKFNLRLDEMLNADNFNFIHDVTGIINNIARDEYPATDFGLFVPRFAGKDSDITQPKFNPADYKGSMLAEESATTDKDKSKNLDE